MTSDQDISSSTLPQSIQQQVVDEQKPVQHRKDEEMAETQNVREIEVLVLTTNIKIFENVRLELSLL